MKHRFSSPALVLLLTLIYFGAGRLGLSLAFLHTSASPVWPPTGLALAAVLLAGYRVWPAIFIGAFLVNWTTAGSLPTSIAIAIGNTLEGVAGAALARRFAGGADAFDRAPDILRFVFFAAIPSTALSATIGVTSLGLGELMPWDHYALVWFTWWMGDLVSAILIAPLLLIWLRRRRPAASTAQVLEAAALLALVFAVSWMLFPGGERFRGYPVSFVGVPLLVWSAYRFHQHGAVSAAFVMSAVALWGTLQDSGPFAVDNPNDSLLLLQAFMAVNTLTCLMLAALVAEREELLQAERAARSEVERANRAKDEFIAVVSHELRTPLTPALLTLSLLERSGQLPGPAAADLAQVRRHVELEAKLIDDLLDLSRIRSGKLSLKHEVVDLHALIERALEICERRAQTEICLDLRARDRFVHGDPARLQQVLWNLLSNAIKFTSTGDRITVRTHNLMPGRVQVEVSDTGPGIAPHLLPNVFNAFEQGDAGSQRHFGGLGLGLAIARAIMTAHGGSISAASDGQGGGATFTLEMDTVSEVPAPASVQETAPPLAARPLHILLVEDHDATRAALARMLEQLGHTVHTAATFAAAVEMASAHRPDVVISDIGLPDGSGYDLMRRLPPGNGIVGFALSGYGMEEDIRKSKSAGFREHLTKPVDAQRLASLLADVADHLEGQYSSA